MSKLWKRTTALIGVLAIGLAGVPAGDCEHPLNIEYSQINGSTLEITISNSTDQPQSGYIVGEVEIAGETFEFFSYIEMDANETVTWILHLNVPITVLSSLDICDNPPAVNEGSNPVGVKSERKSN